MARVEKVEFWQPTSKPHPSIFWGTDPLFGTNAKLFIADIVRLKEHPDVLDVYFYGNHPFRKVEIIGLIRSFERRKNYIIYDVDDGTAAICCKTEDSYISNVKLGMLVRLQGCIEKYKDTKEIHVHDMTIVNDPNIEYLHWLEVMTLKRKFYNQSFILPAEIQEKSSPVNLLEKRTGIFPSTDSELTETEFKNYIAQHINDQGMLEFSLSAIRNLPKIEEYAKKVQNYSKTSDTYPLFLRVMNALVNDGFLLRKSNKLEVYEVIRQKQNIGPALLKIIQEAMPMLEPLNGIKREDILTKLTKIVDYETVPRSVVLESLKLLEESNTVYQLNDGEYRCVNVDDHELCEESCK